MIIRGSNLKDQDKIINKFYKVKRGLTITDLIANAEPLKYAKSYKNTILQSSKSTIKKNKSGISF